MQFDKKNTKWILFLGSSSEPENRHIFDIAYGLMCLEASGVDENGIEIYIDGSNRGNIDKLVHTGSSNKFVIKKTEDFFADKDKNTHENVVIFVSGHGSHFGIDASITVTPHKLLRRIKETPNLKHAVAFLGQCYAGTFNYTSAGRGSNGDVEVIFIGATSLHPSLSIRTTEQLKNGQDLPWIANVFLLFVFKWFQNPVDIDGDGKNTVMDCYKYAGCMANNLNKAGRRSTFEQSLTARGKYMQAAAATQTARAAADPLLGMKELQEAAAEQQYNQSFDLYHIHQECWILNSVPAQRIFI